MYCFTFLDSEYSFSIVSCSYKFPIPGIRIKNIPGISPAVNAFWATSKSSGTGLNHCWFSKFIANHERAQNIVSMLVIHPSRCMSIKTCSMCLVPAIKLFYKCRCFMDHFASGHVEHFLFYSIRKFFTLYSNVLCMSLKWRIKIL